MPSFGIQKLKLSFPDLVTGIEDINPGGPKLLIVVVNQRSYPVGCEWSFLGGGQDVAAFVIPNRDVIPFPLDADNASWSNMPFNTGIKNLVREVSRGFLRSVACVVDHSEGVELESVVVAKLTEDVLDRTPMAIFWG